MPHFVQTIAEKITKSKSFTQENEKNDPAKKKIPFATTTYYN